MGVVLLIKERKNQSEQPSFSIIIAIIENADLGMHFSLVTFPQTLDGK